MKREPIWTKMTASEETNTVSPQNNLRGRMCMFDVDQTHLARLLKRGSTYVSLRLNGHALWSMEDALTMMKAFHIPRERFLDYFGTDRVQLPGSNSPTGL